MKRSTMNKFRFVLTEKHIKKFCSPNEGEGCRFFSVDEGGVRCSKFSYIQEYVNKGVAEKRFYPTGNNCIEKLEVIITGRNLLIGKEFIYQRTLSGNEERGILQDIKTTRRYLVFCFSTKDFPIIIPIRHLTISTGKRVINFGAKKDAEPYSIKIVVDPYER